MGEKKVTKVASLHPLSSGFTLQLRVVHEISKTERARPDGSRLVMGQYLCGDDSGQVIVVARGHRQCHEMVPGVCVELQNARCELLEGKLRVEADAYGSILGLEKYDIQVNNTFNASEEEFELVQEEPASGRQ